MSLTCFLNSDSQRNTRTNEFQKKKKSPRSIGWLLLFLSIPHLLKTKQNKTKQNKSSLHELVHWILLAEEGLNQAQGWILLVNCLFLVAPVCTDRVIMAI
jgi:hypothetical protein